MRADPETRRAIEQVLDDEAALSGMSQLDRIDLADRCAEAAERIQNGVEEW